MKKVTLFLVILLTMASYCQKQNVEKKSEMGEQDTTSFAEKTQPLSEDSLPSPDDFVPYDEAPKPIKTFQPVYPDSAKKAGIEGEVWVQALIDRHGKVIEARCLKEISENPDIFCDPATQAALQYEYKPALVADKPVAVWVLYKIKFSLK